MTMHTILDSFTIVCAWCDQVLNKQQFAEVEMVQPELPQTHTICPSCFDKMCTEINSIKIAAKAETTRLKFSPPSPTKNQYYTP